MQIIAYKTHPITVGESLLSIIDQYIPLMEEGMILAVTSKIISLCEQSVIEKTKVPSKEKLIHQSADAYLKLDECYQTPHAIQLTIKNNILIPSAGIDESNGNGLYILYPEDIQRSAFLIWEHLCKKFGTKNLGVIITDSHTTPMRRGVVGIGLGWCGFNPLYNYIGTPDCFGYPLRVTMANVLDGLAVAAVYCMGEGNEQTPMAIIQNAPKIEFQGRAPTQEEIDNFSIPMSEDLYAPLLYNAPWVFP